MLKTQPKVFAVLVLAILTLSASNVSAGYWIFFTKTNSSESVKSDRRAVTIW